MSALHDLLSSHPTATLFLVVGLGYLLGRIRIFGLDLGPVSGVLFAGLVFGYRGYGLSSMVQSMGFVLFIFSVGLEAGPGFFSVVRVDGLRYLALAVVITSTGFAAAWLLADLMGLAPGGSAGLLAGALTSSPTLAAAQEALRSGQVSPGGGLSTEEAMTNVTTAYAITYIFGLVGLILAVRLLPRLMGIRLRDEAARLAGAAEGGVRDETDVVPDVAVRAYRIEREELTGRPLHEVGQQFPGIGTISRLRRKGEFLEPHPDLMLEIGDELAMVGTLANLLEIGPRLGPEVNDSALREGTIESGRIVVLRRQEKIPHLKPDEIANRYGCFIARVQRLGIDVPVDSEIEFRAGDVLHVTGYHATLELLAEEFGHLERRTGDTDLITFALGIAAGTLLGTLSVTIGGISVGLGAAGGLLAAGLTIGYLRALRPTFGRVPAAVRRTFMDLGLLVFMAGVGLRAGTGVIETLGDAGLELFGAGIVVTLLPVGIGYAFGRYILKLNPVLLLGGITGSLTSGAALSIVNREAGNAIPALGYTGAYAFANVLLTIAGSVILLL